jgi:hypothetical protein
MKRSRTKAFIFTALLAASLFSLSVSAAHAQWANTYGGAERDYIYAVRQTADGGYIVAAESYSFGAGDSDFLVIKLDSAGSVTWQKTYGGSSADYAYSVQQTADGGYIVAGQSHSFSAGDSDILVLKLDNTGNITWQKIYGGSSEDYPLYIQQTTDSGYIIAGSTNSFGAGNYDVWLLKLDGSGNVTWQKTYGESLNEWPYAIQQTADDGYIVAGSTNSFGAGAHDVWLLKLDSSGNVTWQKTYGGSLPDHPFAIQQTVDGGYIVAGDTNSLIGGRQAWVLKLNSAGDVAWQKTYGGSLSDYAYWVQQTTDGGYILAGGTYSFGGGNGDVWLMKLNSRGDVAWQKTYGGKNHESANFVQQTSDAGYVVAGNALSFGAGDYDLWVLKLDSDGYAGSCPFEGTSTATASNTEVTPAATTVTPGTTSVIGVNVTIVPFESDATSTEVCPLIDKPLALKVGATRKRQGGGTITSRDGLIDCPEACQAEYNPGAMVTLTATPSDLSTFLGWKPASLGCEGTDPCQVTMDKKKSVKAFFQGPNKLKVVTTFKNEATGTVTSGGALITCPGDCEELYILNAPVTLTATAGPGSTFVKWTGTPCKDELTNVCTFEMNKNITVKAVFEPTP